MRPPVPFCASRIGAGFAAMRTPRQGRQKLLMHDLNGLMEVLRTAALRLTTRHRPAPAMADPPRALPLRSPGRSQAPVSLSTDPLDRGSGGSAPQNPLREWIQLRGLLGG